MTVDFLIPDEKIIVETHGPHHFIQYVTHEKNSQLQKELNLNTEFNHECLIFLGYKIISLDFEEPFLSKKSMELNFFEQYEKIRQNH